MADDIKLFLNPRLGVFARTVLRIPGVQKRAANADHRLLRILLKEDFTIISNNCWGASLYPYLEKPYLTPFVGLFVPPACYVRLLADLQANLSGQLTFAKESKYEWINRWRYEQRLAYPVGILNGSIELNFMHYKTEEEAADKWLRRVQRISADPARIFVKFCDRDFPTLEEIAAFDSLPLANKVFFSSKPLNEISSAVWLPEFENEGRVCDGLELNRRCLTHFDTAGWLSHGTNRGLTFRLLRAAQKGTSSAKVETDASVLDVNAGE